MIPAGRDGDDLAQPRRHAGLPVIIGAERGHGAIRFQHQGMEHAGGNKWKLQGLATDLERFGRRVVRKSTRAVKAKGGFLFPIGQTIEKKVATRHAQLKGDRSGGIRDVPIVQPQPLVVAVLVLVDGDLSQDRGKRPHPRAAVLADGEQREHVTTAGNQARQGEC